MHLTEIQALAEKAWNKVRGDDPVWNECSRQHRETKTEEARGIAEHGALSDSPFDKEFTKLMSEPPAPTSYGGVSPADGLTEETRARRADFADSGSEPLPPGAPIPTETKAKKARKAASKHAAKVASKKKAEKKAAKKVAKKPVKKPEKKPAPSPFDQLKQSVVDTFSPKREDEPPTRSMPRFPDPKK